MNKSCLGWYRRGTKCGGGRPRDGVEGGRTELQWRELGCQSVSSLLKAAAHSMPQQIHPQ